MDRLHAMQVFVKVAESGGFAEAARQLHMSPPAVTRAVSALEETIGTRLLTRTTRSVKVTEAGARYLEDSKRILADIVAAETAAAQYSDEPRGTLIITAPALFGQAHVMPIVQDYLDRYPQVNARAQFHDRVVNIVDEGVDVAFRVGHLPDSSHSAIRVGTVRRVLCGAPSYFAQHGKPESLEDLARHKIIAVTGTPTLDWRFARDVKTGTKIEPRLYCDSAECAVAAALKGWGLAQVLSYHVSTQIADGTLTTVLEDFEEEPLPINILHPEGRKATAKVRAFVELAVERLRGA